MAFQGRPTWDSSLDSDEVVPVSPEMCYQLGPRAPAESRRQAVTARGDPVGFPTTCLWAYPHCGFQAPEPLRMRVASVFKAVREP